MKIKEMIKDQRPRERLINEGIEKVSNSELLAIILGSGNKTTSVIELANKLLIEFNSLEKLSNANYEQLIKIKGIGKSKATKLISTFELNRRIKNTNIKGIQVTNSQIIYDKYSQILNNKKQEYFYVIFLNAKNIIIADKLLFIGAISSASIDIRIIFKEACLNDASAIICIHNHPSGDTKPSKADIEVTKNLITIGQLFNIKILDHLIIGKNNYLSIIEYLKLV